MRINIDETIFLQTLTVSDAEELANLINKDKEYLGKWLTWVKNSVTIKDHIKTLKNAIENANHKKGYEFGIFIDNKIIGTIWLNPIDYNNSKASIGFWLGADFQGRGIMTRACNAITKFGFEEVNLNRIEMVIAQENERSKKIAERLGYTLEGVLREYEYINLKKINSEIYSLLKSEWDNKILSKY